jgi:diguanylate cyclase (GGDEF)-like protein
VSKSSESDSLRRYHEERSGILTDSSRALQRRSGSFRDLVSSTAALLSRDVPTSQLVDDVRPLLGEFFAASAILVVLCRSDDPLPAAEPDAGGLTIFGRQTVRVLRGAEPMRSLHGRSLHVPVRFGGELLGAVGIDGGVPNAYTDTDLGLLVDWAALFAVRLNGSQLAAANTELEALVGTDALTGLRNRHGLDAELERIWGSAGAEGESLGIVMADVDFFKSYNDSYGHLGGDACLRRVAQALAVGLRAGDVCARFGGEEFVVLLRDADLDMTVTIAERLRERVAELGIAHAGSTLGYVTASFGATTAQVERGSAAADVLAQADALLYAAKAAGRNRVAAAGYAAVSPAARAANGVESNLPVANSSFCGRVDDISRVLAALERSRLVTIVAFGGIGKTRLSIEAARRRRAAFRNGVWFVDLAGAADPELLAERVAAALGLPDVPGSRTVDGIAALLAARELLIVLDNCEHLIAACAAFCTAVLAGAPQVRILATSREPLDVADETVIRLAPFALPPPGAVVRTGDVSAYPALQLFVDRASAVAPLQLDDTAVATIAHICRRLDGIALAIELAAARTRMIALDDLRARLDAAFAVVARPVGADVARRRTLRGLIDWSYGLLDAREQRVFRALGIFAGTFTLEFAAAVCADGDVLDVLEELVDKSLVVVESAASGARVFRLFVSLRDYAAEALEGAGELAECRRRLHLTLRDRAAAIGAAASTVRWRESMRPLEAVADDVRAFLEAAIGGGGDPAGGARVAADLAEYLREQNLAHEARTWLERALAQLALPPAVRAKTLNALLWQQPLFGSAHASQALAQEALELATAAGDDAQISAALFHIGDALFDLSDYTRAREFALRARERFVAAGDAFGEAYACNLIGASFELSPDDAGPAEAVTWFERSIALCRQLERHGFAARVLGNVAESYFFSGRIDDAIALTADALVTVDRAHDLPAVAWLRSNLGLFCESAGEFERAKDTLLEGLLVAIEIGDDWLVATCCDHLAGIALERGKPDRGAQLLGSAQATLDALGLVRQPLFAEIADRCAQQTTLLLGEGGFAREASAGTQLTRDQIRAIAETL